MAEAVISHFQPIQNKIGQLIKDPEYLMDVLKEGSGKAECLAEKTIEEVRQKLGVEPSVTPAEVKINVS